MTATNPAPPVRVMCYLDGFNLYFGLRQAGLRDCYWLDMGKLAANLCRPSQTLTAVKYFTARITGGLPNDTPARFAARNSKRQRQTDYLDALAATGGIQIIEGQYLAKPARCLACSATWTTHEEKMTDVCIATELLCDAFRDRFDTALIVSADSDLVPPIEALRQEFPRKRVVICFPPCRNSERLKQCASGYLTIQKNVLRRSHLPETVQRSDGYQVSRPTSWH